VVVLAEPRMFLTPPQHESDRNRSTLHQGKIGTLHVTACTIIGALTIAMHITATHATFKLAIIAEEIFLKELIMEQK